MKAESEKILRNRINYYLPILIFNIFGIIVLSSAIYYQAKVSQESLFNLNQKGAIVLDNIRAMQLLSRSLTPKLFENTEEPLSHGLILHETLFEVEELWLTVKEDIKYSDDVFGTILNGFKENSKKYQQGVFELSSRDLVKIKEQWTISYNSILDYLDQLATKVKEDSFKTYLIERKKQTIVQWITITLVAAFCLINSAFSIRIISSFRKQMQSNQSDNGLQSDTFINQEKALMISKHLHELADLLSGKSSK